MKFTCFEIPTRQIYLSEMAWKRFYHFLHKYTAICIAKCQMNKHSSLLQRQKNQRKGTQMTLKAHKLLQTQKKYLGVNYKSLFAFELIKFTLVASFVWMCIWIVHPNYIYHFSAIG